MQAHLQVVTQDWTGWCTEQPKPVEKKIEVEKGDTIPLRSVIGSPAIIIGSITENSLLLVSSHLSPRNEGSGINLSGDFSNLQTTVLVGQTAKFSTQTMDAGTHISITLLDIVNTK